MALIKPLHLKHWNTTPRTETKRKKQETASTRVKQSKVLSTKAHRAYTFMFLASGPNIGFSKGESKIESQVLQISLKQAKISGQSFGAAGCKKN